MDQSWSFKLFGFTVDVQMSHLLIAGLYALILLANQAPLIEIIAWPFILFGSVLVHELGHAFAIRHYDMRVGHIVLHGLGGHVTHAPTTASRQLVISLAGPLAGLSLGFLVLGLTRYFGVPPGFSGVVWMLLFVNIGYSLFNLFPMLPLDGGNALQSALRMRMRERAARRTAGLIGTIVGIAVALLSYTGQLEIAGMRFSSFFVVGLAAFCAYTSYQQYEANR